jgi:pilus assembly protein CpaE
MPAHGGQEGQASVELVALLPLVVLVGAMLWQAVVAGQALWLSGAAARAAARAAAVGGDAEAAARGALPPRLEHGIRVRTGADGTGVRVALHVPSVLTSGSLATVESSAAFPDQRP